MFTVRGVALAAAASLLLSVYAAASAGAAAPAEPVAAATKPGEQVSIPFAPPIGRDLRYRHVQERTSAGTPARAEHDIVLRFDPSGEGYRMLMRLDIPNLPPASLRDPSVRFMLQPQAFQVNAEGAITSFAGEEQYWEGIQRIAERMARDEGGAGTATMRNILASMRALPVEERLALATRNIAPVLEFSATAMHIGEAAEIDTEEPLFASDATVKRVTRISLVRADPLSAEFTVESRADPESFKAAMTALMRLAPGGEQKVPPQMEIQETANFTVSRQTGLATYVRHVTRANVPGSTQSAERTVTISLVD